MSFAGRPGGAQRICSTGAGADVGIPARRRPAGRTSRNRLYLNRRWQLLSHVNAHARLASQRRSSSLTGDRLTDGRVGAMAGSPRR